MPHFIETHYKTADLQQDRIPSGKLENKFATNDFGFVRKQFEKAVSTLYHKDFAIIERQSSERSIVFRLGLYVAQNFEKCGYHVDCEYNRRDDEPKSLKGRQYNYPDLIVHRRGNSEDNLLVVEVKTPTDTQASDIANDIDKLTGFIQEKPYLYEQGVHVYISETICCLAWYKKGEAIEYRKYGINKDTHALSLVDTNSTQNKCIFDKWYCNSNGESDTHKR